MFQSTFVFRLYQRTVQMLSNFSFFFSCFEAWNKNLPSLWILLIKVWRAHFSWYVKNVEVKHLVELAEHGCTSATLCLPAVGLRPALSVFHTDILTVDTEGGGDTPPSDHQSWDLHSLSLIMPEAIEAVPGPFCCVCVCGQISIRVCVCSAVVQVNLSVPPEETADHPPATVIYSLRTNAVARPPTLWGVWVMTGGFCEENFPFYLIKCGAWPTPHSGVCLTAFHSSYLRRKLWLC